MRFKIHHQIEPDLSVCAKNKNYKGFYAKQLGITWDRKQYVVHHLDHNRENNKLENLVLIPAKIHALYHMYATNFSNMQDMMSPTNYYVDRPCDLIRDLNYYINAKAIIHYFICVRDEILRDRLTFDLCDNAKEFWDTKDEMVQCKWDSKKSVCEYDKSFLGLTL